MKSGLRVKVSFVYPVILLLIAASAGFSRSMNQEQRPGGPPVAPAKDPIRQLNLSPEQLERIRAIREQQKEERFAIHQRLREANLELERVLDSDNPDEDLVEQRLRDVATAQAASMRMRVLSEVRIRRVLTPEQLSTLRTLRQSARSFRRRSMDNGDHGRRRENVERQRGFPKRRNGLSPLFHRRDDAQRRPRP